jgi:hypothetical protein
MKTVFLLVVIILICFGCKKQVVNGSLASEDSNTSIHKCFESRGLVGLWPNIIGERIISISFLSADPNEMWNYDKLIDVDTVKKCDSNDFKHSRIIFEVPQPCLDHCKLLINDAVKFSKQHRYLNAIDPQEIMIFKTDKSKYITWVETEITNSGKSKVLAQDWQSYELGEYLKKCGFPVRK